MISYATNHSNYHQLAPMIEWAVNVTLADEITLISEVFEVGRDSLRVSVSNSYRPNLKSPTLHSLSLISNLSTSYRSCFSVLLLPHFLFLFSQLLTILCLTVCVLTYRRLDTCQYGTVLIYPQLPPSTCGLRRLVL